MPDPPVSADRIYQEVCADIRATDEISFKLMGLVPLVTGAAFLTFCVSDELSEMPKLIIAVSVFAALITLALFRWELRNIQKCNSLLKRADEMAKVDSRTMPPKPSGIGKTKAEAAVYSVTIVTWLLMPVIFLAFNSVRESIWVCYAVFAILIVFATAKSIETALRLDQMAADLATDNGVVSEKNKSPDRANETKTDPACLFQSGPRPFGERITPMLGVLCGLAIATGMAQVAPRLFRFAQYDSITRPWYFKWTVLIALLSGLGDVMMTFLPRRPRSQPIIIILGIFTLILVFMLFANAHRILEFAWVFAFMCLSFLVYGCLVWRYEKTYLPYDYTLSIPAPDSRPANLALVGAMWFRFLRFVMAVIAVILCYYSEPAKENDISTTFALVVMATAIIASWVFIYREMERQV